MKRYLKPKYIVLGITIVVFCFVPLIPVSYEVTVEEEYVDTEPYTVQEEVSEPYSTWETYWEKEPYTDITYPYNWDTRGFDYSSPQYITKFRDVQKTRQVTKVRTVTKDVTKYREVTKTRLVIETQTKRVSILGYLLRQVTE